MRCDQVSELLASHARILMSAGAIEESQSINALASAIAAKGSVTLARLLSVVDAASKPDGVGGRVSSSLEAFAELLSHLKKQQAANDVSAISKLVGHVGSRLPEYVLGADVTAKTAKSTKASKAPKEIDHARARRIADQLSEKVLDADRFDQFLSELANDRSVTKPLLDRVSQHFLGHDVVFSSKKKIFEKFRERSNVDILNSGRAKVIDRVRA